MTALRVPTATALPRATHGARPNKDAGRHRRVRTLPKDSGQQAISGVVAALEKAYGMLRTVWKELPEVVITVFYDRHRTVRGYFWRNQWHSADKPASLHEIHIDSTILGDPPDQILRTLVHEAVHARALVLGRKETSRDGRWHNGQFRKMAVEMGLIVEPDKRIGATTPGLQPEWLAGQYAPHVRVIAAASKRLWQVDKWQQFLGLLGANGNGIDLTTVTPPGKPKGRMLKAICRCDEPRIIRVARSTLEQGDITCTECGGSFHISE